MPKKMESATRSKHCKWLSDDFTRVCVNDRSEYCADFVDEDICIACKHKETERDYNKIALSLQVMI